MLGSWGELSSRLSGSWLLAIRSHGLSFVHLQRERERALVSPLLRKLIPYNRILIISLNYLLKGFIKYSHTGD